MKRVFKQFNKKLLKEDFRKLGINFITASAIGGFITHATKMTPMAIILIVWIGVAGLALVLFGLHKVDN